MFIEHEKRTSLSVFIEHWKKNKTIIVHWKGQGYQCMYIKQDKAINVYDHRKKDKAINVYDHWKKDKAFNVHRTLKQWQGYQCLLIIDKRTRLSMFIEHWKRTSPWSVKCKSQVFSDTWKKAQKVQKHKKASDKKLEWKRSTAICTDWERQ